MSFDMKFVVAFVFLAASIAAFPFVELGVVVGRASVLLDERVQAQSHALLAPSLASSLEPDVDLSVVVGACVCSPW